MTTWLQTHTGKKFHPLKPTRDEIDIRDIAHGLSLQCRFGGQCSEFYSVAQHSVLASRMATPALALTALLHDASEAYLSDLVRPVKQLLPQYYEVEETVMRAISEVYGTVFPLPQEVKEIDNRLLFTERERLLSPAIDDWGSEIENVKPYENFRIQPWNSERAKLEFLNRFIELN